MKKILTRIGALIICTVLFLGAPVSAYAVTSYTYNYDFWGEYQECPDAYEVAGVVTSGEMGLEKKLNNPEGIMAYHGHIYICDTGNNRILELEPTETSGLKLVREITEFTGAEINTFAGPKDIAISEAGDFFICDTGNARIVKLDKDLNYLMEFIKPDDTTLDPELVFTPTKIVIDTADRVYCISQGINKGLVKYESDGTFSGFVGATPVTYNFWDYIWKRFATKEQLATMMNFVPTEYDNICMDKEGFIYAVTGNCKDEDLKSGSASAIRKLNLLGNDILVQNGEWGVYGDLYMGGSGSFAGASQFTDVTVFDNDIYVCLDKRRGRLFGYDDQGKLCFAFSGSGPINGYFRRPSGITNIGYSIYVLDQQDCSVTVFNPTAFGNLLFEAVDKFDNGEYEASGKCWQKIMDIDGNYDLAYIGIGRALLREKHYKEAMDYFELKYDDENYSKAFKQYRKEWVEDNIGIIIIVLVLLFAIPLTIGRIKSIKREIDIADIFNR